MKVSIIIPVFNEEKTIALIVEKVKAAKLPKGVDKEILVVDDASTDTTSRIVKKLAGLRFFRHKVNRGKGASIKTAFGKARGEIVIIQDADLEYGPADYVKLLAPILMGKTTVVFGSRFSNLKFTLFGKGKTPLPLHFIGNKILTSLTNGLFGSHLTDMETCYKVFVKKILDLNEIKASRFDFEPEFTAKILKKGLTICEIPITISPRGYNEGKKITWRDGLVAIKVLLRERLGK